VRLVDLVLRQGHLSEDALMHAILSGDRPRHLDACDLCARRALDLGRWLEDVRQAAVEAADEAFPAERLAAQRGQIMRRLEELDAPARVLAFPAAPVAAPRNATNRRVAPGWLGVAAAAGLVVGVIGGQMSARLGDQQTGVSPAVPAPQPALALDLAPGGSSILELNLESFTPEPLRGLDDMTPRLVEGRNVVAQR
jgi:hypothetical protein